MFVLKMCKLIECIICFVSFCLLFDLNHCQNSLFSVMTPWQSLSPKLSLLSHIIKGDTIDIMANSSVHIKCTGEKPIVWIFPNNNPQYDPIIEVAKVKSKCDNSQSPKCITDVVIPEVNFEMTGYFKCHYNDSNKDALTDDNSASIYIYVNDPDDLIVPLDGNSDFMFIALFQSQPATIPCRPSNSKAKVSLWKIHTISGKPQEIKVNSTLGITYNPKDGFYFEYPRWDAETSLLDCRVELGDREQTSQINIHWSVLPVELNPLIDDSRAKNIFINSTFILKCFVHIELGVIIVISWDAPNKQSSRVTETMAETQRIDINGQSYDTVSKNLTITGAQLSDQGIYHCNVTDGKGRMFSASKKIIIYANGLPPSYVNFTIDINNTKPLIRKVGDNVRFVVDVQAFPDFQSVQLIWYKNGQQIDANDKHYKTGTNIGAQNPQAFLNISQIRLEDSGTYVLVGNTSDMLSNITMNLLVSGSPNIKIINISDFYEIGKTYQLECLAIGYPKAIVWWKWYSCPSPEDCSPSDKKSEWIDIENDRNSTNLMFINSEQVLRPNISLLYLNQVSLQVMANQSGAYRCYAYNNNSSTVYSQTSFIVTDAINGFSISSSTDEPTEMSDITLTCKASVYNYTHLYWSRKAFEDMSEGLLIKENMTDLIQVSTEDEYSLTLSIELKSVKISDSGIYTCEATSRENNNDVFIKEIKLDIQNISAPVLLDTNMKGEMIERTPNTQIEFRCFVKGRPKPVVKWYRNKQEFKVQRNTGIKLEDNNQRLIFTRLLDKDSGLYECEAYNKGGKVWRSARLKVDRLPDDSSAGLSTEEIFVIVLFVMVGTVMIFMAIYIGKKIRQERKQKRELEFFSHNLFETGQIEMFNPDMPLDEQIELLPYDPRYEFPKERLKLGRTLGQGAFGRVVKAEAIGLEDGETSTIVAVKMLKERADINQRKALMAELKILIHLGRHLNIVNLLGAVTKNLIKGELLVIVEYCKFGNLRHYLLAYRDSFVNQLNSETGLIDSNIKTIQDMKKMSSNANNKSPVYENVFAANGINNPNYTTTQLSTKKDTVRYADIMHSQQTGSYSNGYMPSVNSNNTAQETGCDSGSGSGSSSGGYRGESIRKTAKDKVVTTCDLLCFAFQCARGMQYLAHRKLIHRDLAARNVLLAEDNIVKICDFGLAKDVYKYDNYVKKNDGPLPIKWMAIESIRDKVFTSKSDVWSFGILLWEFFTLGGNPYPGIEIDEEFYKRLKAGYRMEKPDFSPNEMYQLMNHCWNAEPKERPDFMEIADIIGTLLEANVRQHYLDLNDPYQQMNEQILNNNDYLRMSTMRSSSGVDFNGDYLNMKSDDRKSDPLVHYDNLGIIRPVNSNSPVPKEPMEIVPMIQLDSYGQRYDNNWIESNTSDDYLTMDSTTILNNSYSTTSSDVSPPPPYSLVV